MNDKMTVTIVYFLANFLNGYGMAYLAFHYLGKSLIAAILLAVAGWLALTYIRYKLVGE